MSKDLWFAEMERLMYEGASYESACDRAHDSLIDRLANHADYLRKRAREQPPTPTPQNPHNRGCGDCTTRLKPTQHPWRGTSHEPH